MFSSENLVSWRNETASTHVAKRDPLAEQGFRPLSLALSGTVNDPRYSAVMVKRPNVIATKSVINKSQAEYQQIFEEMASDGFGPFILTATGPKNNALFAGSFRKMNVIPFTRSNISKQDFIDLNLERHGKGEILLWADSFGTNTEPRYCAIWGPNPQRIAWNIDAVEENGSALQQRFSAMRAVGARPALIAYTPSGKIMEAFVDSKVGHWSSKINMTLAEFDAEVAAQKAKGRFPVCISAHGVGIASVFAAIFADREEHLPRVFRATGTTAIPNIDAGIEKYVRAHNLRGAALAVVKGTRLVYTRGYTFAEESPHYNEILPTTPFRQASVSKAFCAVAVWKLIEQKKLSLTTTMQSVLNLKQPDGSNPKDSRFNDITIQHLLESRSGIKQGAVWGAVEASIAFGHTLPSNGNEVARWTAGLDLTGMPGNKNNTVYGNTDYFLLSLIVAKIANASTFEAALATLVLNPLKQTRTRQCRSLNEDQPSDESRHHMTVHDPDGGWPLFQLATGKSDRSQDRPRVPEHYGTYDLEMFDGCGGLSSAVIDVARLVAMLACRSNNPVLNSSTIDSMLALAVEATQTQKNAEGKASHGYHGMDSAKVIDAEKHQIKFKKGGWLPGQGSSFIGTTGGYFFVFAQNGNSVPNVEIKWLEEIKSTIEAEDWGNVDRFPDYGMPTLTTRLQPDRVVKFDFDLSDSLFVKQVEKSMERPRRRDPR
jgi:CubicO group peptidase (beta-lactamase class C family)